MPIAALLPLIDGALVFLTKALPLLKQWKLRGEISPEQQQEIMDRYASLKNELEGQFSGPEWEVRK